jgi:hypothetical protein
MPIKIFMTLLHFTLLVFWFICWRLHFSIQVRIHDLLTAVFMFGVFYHCTAVFQFYRRQRYEDELFPFVIRATFNVMTMTLLVWTILFIEQGWGFIRDSIPFTSIVCQFIFALIIVISTYVMRVTRNGVVFSFLFMTIVYTALLLIREISLSVRLTLQHITARLLAVADDGINARSTPIWMKCRLYQYFQVVVAVAGVVFIVYIIIDLCGVLQFLADEVTGDVLLFGMFAVLACMFRIRGQAKLNYLHSDYNDEPAYEYSLNDILMYEPSSEHFASGVEWQEGMPLPRQPTIVDSSGQVIFESPAGGTTVPAGVAFV